jgi:hypothetical protein
MRTNDYLIHPFAALFPQLHKRSVAYLAFVEGVRAFGPGKVVLHEGKVLGGWHSLRACRDLGIDPPFEEYVGDDPLGFVLQEQLTQPRCNKLQLILIVEENSVWAEHGGDRKSKGKAEIKKVLGSLERHMRPGVPFGSLVPFPFSNVRMLHSLRSRQLKDDDGEPIPGTIALLPEVFDAMRSGQIETLGKVRWLADQTHDDQRKYLANIKFKGRKFEPKPPQPKPAKTRTIAQAVLESGYKALFDYLFKQGGIAPPLKMLSNHAGQDPEALQGIEVFRAIVRKYGGQDDGR